MVNDKEGKKKQTAIEGQSRKAYGDGLNSIRMDDDQLCIVNTTGGADKATSAIVAVDGKIFTGFYRPQPGIVKMTVHEMGIPEPSVIAQVQQKLRTMAHS